MKPPNPSQRFLTCFSTACQTPASVFRMSSPPHLQSSNTFRFIPPLLDLIHIKTLSRWCNLVPKTRHAGRGWCPCQQQYYVLLTPDILPLFRCIYVSIYRGASTRDSSCHSGKEKRNCDAVVEYYWKVELVTTWLWKCLYIEQNWRAAIGLGCQIWNEMF